MSRNLNVSTSWPAKQRETSSTLKNSFNDLPSSIDPDENVPDLRMPNTDLAPWMEKAISAGQYTLEQANVLRAQRQNVVEVAHAAIQQYERERTSKSAMPLTTTTSLKNTIDNFATARKNAKSPLAKPSMFPYCKFRSCQACRPTFRERTWERFENGDAKDVSSTAGRGSSRVHETRPLASRELMTTIGLKALTPLIPPTHHLKLRSGSVSDSDIRLQNVRRGSDASSSLRGTGSVCITEALTPETQDVADAGFELDSNSGDFRDSIIRAFRGVPTRKPSAYSIRTMEIGSELEQGMASCKDPDDFSMMEATGMPLPEGEPVDRHVGDFGEDEELELVESISVTEESADLGVADIITSV